MKLFILLSALLLVICQGEDCIKNGYEQGAGPDDNICITKVDHQSVRSIEFSWQYKQRNDQYKIYAKFQPSISVDSSNACDVFAAIDKKYFSASEGQWIGGPRNYNCGTSPNKAQVYVRSRSFNVPDTSAPHTMHLMKRMHGIMYAYYFPKDQNFAGSVVADVGSHIHDWEEVIVWVNEDWSAPLGSSVFDHGSLVTNLSPTGTLNWCGDSDMHPQVKYSAGSNFVQGDGIHQFLHNRGSECASATYSHEIAVWDDMNWRHQYTLERADWGKASPKITDENFESKMDQGYQSFLDLNEKCKSREQSLEWRGEFCTGIEVIRPSPPPLPCPFFPFC